MIKILASSQLYRLTNEVNFEKVDKASDLENWLIFKKSFAILAY